MFPIEEKTCKECRFCKPGVTYVCSDEEPDALCEHEFYWRPSRGDMRTHSDNKACGKFEPLEFDL